MEKFYLLKGRKRKGPFFEDKLLKNGMTPDSMVSRNGKKWIKASEVPALAKYFPPEPQLDELPSYYQPPQYDETQFPRKRPNASDSIEDCLSKFLDFSGRARRSEFFWFALFTLASPIFALKKYTSFIFFFGVGTFICPMPMIAVTVRRLHDTNHSGWWLYSFLLLIVLFIATSVYVSYCGMNSITKIILDVSDYIFVPLAVALLVFCCLDSDKGENKYGRSPKYQ